MTLGEKISIQRKRKNITQETLSEMAGISLRTIQRIENNKSVPRVYILKILADQLEIGIKELTEEQNNSVGTISKSSSNSLTQKINLAGLSVILLPIVPVLIMLVIWYSNKNDEITNTTGKRIIIFQILWLILTFFMLACTKIIYYYITGAHSIGHLSPLVPAYLLMLAFNLIVVIYSSFKLQKQELGAIYRFMPLFF